jgi:hypothetical protein
LPSGSLRQPLHTFPGTALGHNLKPFRDHGRYLAMPDDGTGPNREKAMTRNDSVMLVGCLAIAFLAMLSLSAAAPAPRPSTNVTISFASDSPAPLQLSRVHSLTAKSARILSVF